MFIGRRRSPRGRRRACARRGARDGRARRCGRGRRRRGCSPPLDRRGRRRWRRPAPPGHRAGRAAPYRPGAISATPPTRDATTGTPAAIASRIAIGWFSKYDGTTRTASSASAACAGTKPANSAWSPRDARPVAQHRCGRPFTEDHHPPHRRPPDGSTPPPRGRRRRPSPVRATTASRWRRAGRTPAAARRRVGPPCRRSAGIPSRRTSTSASARDGVVRRPRRAEDAPPAIGT